MVEILSVIKSIKSNKSLGPDGITGEFYKTFQDQLGPILQKAYLEYLRKNIVPATWQEARISVILKAGKDLSQPENYRPISLLNEDYKILMTILAARLYQILGAYIQIEQAGIIKRWYMKDILLYFLEVNKALTGLIGFF